jgi:hypothetical protein
MHPSAVWLPEYRLLHRLFPLPAMFGQIVVMRMFREKNDANLRQQLLGF